MKKKRTVELLWKLIVGIDLTAQTKIWKLIVGIDLTAPPKTYCWD